MIALVAAVPFETEHLRRALAPCEVRSCGRLDLYRGTLNGHAAGLIHTGVGKANAAAATALLLESEKVDLVLNFGCGGAYPKSGLDVGDLALATEEIYGDEGVLAPEGFLDMQALGFPLVKTNGSGFYNRFPCDRERVAGVITALEEWAADTGVQVKAGPFVTVSTCSGTLSLGRAMEERTGGVCENMEGASVAQICLRYKVPFVALRGISNLTDDRDVGSWDLQGASRIAQMAVRSILAGDTGRRDRA